MYVTELQGRVQVFTMKDGKTLRVFARETVKIAESNISDEMHIAKNKGLIILTPASEEVPKNKKSGGTK